VIFTAAIKEYADFILDVIDNKSISHRLYRQHTSTDGRNYIKVWNIVKKRERESVVSND